MKKSVPCILCLGTDYAAECANGQCHAEQLDAFQDCYQFGTVDVPRGYGMTYQLPPGRHDRGWPHAR